MQAYAGRFVSSSFSNDDTLKHVGLDEKGLTNVHGIMMKWTIQTIMTTNYHAPNQPHEIPSRQTNVNT